MWQIKNINRPVLCSEITFWYIFKIFVKVEGLIKKKKIFFLRRELISQLEIKQTKGIRVYWK